MKGKNKPATAGIIKRMELKGVGETGIIEQTIASAPSPNMINKT